MYKRVNELLGTEYKSDSEINWINISRAKLSEDFIGEFEDYIDWNCVSSSYQNLSENFIRKYKDKVNWNYITTCQNLSEDFILEFKDKVSSEILSSCQVLSENFIRNNIDIIDWELISRCQILSEEFIEEFEDKLDLKEIVENQPFINPNHPIVSNYRNSYNENVFSKIYQQTKERGWFIGYIEELCNSNFVFLEKDIIGNNYIKARVWWKDLIKTNVTKYYEFIRIIKGV